VFSSALATLQQHQQPTLLSNTQNGTWAPNPNFVTLHEVGHELQALILSPWKEVGN
jgi:hypothetical protein